MNPKLAEAFASGQIVRPLPHEPNLVHLVRALACLSGVKDLDGHPATRSLTQLIGTPEHIVFILLDGLGMNVVRRLPADSFLVRRLAMQMQAVAPSTTAAALTTAATGEWPARHAATGWFTHLPEFGLTAVLLPFVERFSLESLTNRGLTAQDVFPLPAFNARMTHQPLTLMPAAILNTIYATYSRGYTPGLGYLSFAEAVDQAIAQVLAARAPMHIHLYVPDIDTLCHRRGVNDPAVVSLVLRIDAELARLARALEGRARIVITADHGLVDIAHANHMPIFEGDPLLELLLVPPSGDARLPIFHVRPGRRDEFVHLFNQRFAHNMVLLETEEADRLRLFGPEPLSPVARRRFGDFVGIAYRPATLLYHPPKPTVTSREPYVAQHAGLSPDEMHIPLVVA